MDTPSLVSVLAPIASALVAGALAYIAARSTKTHEWRLAMAKEELALRRATYSKFLQSCQYMVFSTIKTKKLEYEHVQASIQLYAELQLFASESVSEAAKALLDVSTHHPDSKEKPAPFHEIASAFAYSARSELNKLKEA